MCLDQDVLAGDVLLALLRARYCLLSGQQTAQDTMDEFEL